MYIYIISRNVFKDVLYLSILILMYVHILAKKNGKKNIASSRGPLPKLAPGVRIDPALGVTILQ